MNEEISTGISFGEWLRQRRHILDLTQQELADQVGCARITLRRIESGSLKPSRELALILLDKLGTPPAQQEQWLRFARGLGEFPEISAGASSSVKSPTNLPTLLSRFIGRQKELQEIVRLIGEYHLITLVGPGGVGKTRLSIQVSQELLEKFPAGVWLVELASQRDPALVPRAVASTIGVRDQPQRSTIDILCDHLQQKEMLIILDNCEHLVETCALLAEKILLSSPGVRILATSREKLGVHGEVIYQVPSLSLPSHSHRLPVTSLQKYEAVELFIERALIAVPGFYVSNENAATLVQICQRLDGIPLIIELAAAKLRVLSLEQIYERLDDRFQLLASGVRTAIPRHQTLQAVIDWSYDLLSPVEQTLFQYLSVFANGWTLEAAEFICTEKKLGSLDIIELLEQLINKSLVHKEETVNEPRYRMLETIREYALQKLDSSGEMKEVCLRHLLFFAKMVEEAERNFKGPNQANWYSRLDKELDNLRMAMTCFKGEEQADVRLRLNTGLWRYWKTRGNTSEGRRDLQQVLEDLPRGPIRQTGDYARALNAAGSLAYYEGDLWYSDQSRKEALAIFQNLDDKVGIADCLIGLGNTASSQGDYDSARKYYEESLAIRKALEDSWGVARLLGNLGLLASFEMDFSRARSLHEQSLNLFRELRDQEGIANELVNLAEVLRHQGELSLANAYFTESALISGKLLDKWGLGYALMGMGDIALEEGDIPAASFLYKDCLILFHKGANFAGLPFALESVAALALARKDPENAARIWGAAETLRKNTNSPMPPPNLAAFQKHLAHLQQQLDATAFRLAWADGQALTIDQVISLALEELS